MPSSDVHLAPAQQPLIAEPHAAEQLASAQPIFELLHLGGPVVWILCVLSSFALAIIIAKCWQYLTLRPGSSQALESGLDLWKSGQTDAAVKALTIRHPVAQIVRAAMEGTLSNTDPQQLKDELSRQANRLMNNLRSYLKPLEVIASLSPLLGLMGTVLGMIDAFQQMQAAGSNVNPAVLSGGIWKALLTTAAGLAVALPVAACFSWLDRKAERVALHINDVVTQVFTHASYKSPTSISATNGERHAA